MSTNNITIKNNNHEIPIPNSFQNLFRPIKVGSSQLPHRFIMAPLTRCRADLNTNIPNDLMAEYYGQRAPYASLIITEYTTISKNAVTFHTEGGLWSDEHVEGWKKTTKAVHDKGGKIFCQIAHGGRAAHPLNNNGEIPVAPSPIKLNHRAGEFFTPKTGEQPENVVPRELTDEEASSIVNDFKAAAIRAKEAGFDGVEVHAANGYLINQFLCESANKRTYGKYSGETMESRFQFCKDVLDAVISVWGSDRVGIRISPLNSYQDMKHEDPMAFTQFFAKKMDEMKLAYLHVMKADFFGIQRGDVLAPARANYKGTLIANTGIETEEAETLIKEDKVDAVAFGTKFLANPDFSKRIKLGAKLNQIDPLTFYTKESKGYTDYPFLEDK